jgi:arginyl-tRNA synthetase
VSQDPLTDLRDAVDAAAAAVGGSGGGERPGLERPPKAELGDYSTNAAMLLAPVLGQGPRDVAALLRDALSESLDGAERIEVAGPGFLNLFLSDPWHRRAVATLLAAGSGHGAGSPDNGERVLIEFVSANPTGPLHVGHGRQAAFGDALARLLSFRGADVEREYYMNDAGGQIDRFAASIAARIRGEEPPEDGYAGDYVAALADELLASGATADDLDELGVRGTAAMRERIEATLERFGVAFDTWSSEHQIRDSGKVDDTLAKLRASGRVFESEGAVWLRTSDLGDEKDRVLIRSDGEATYFLPDIAYHRDKLERGAGRLIDVLGADHHGYVPRMRAALEALGFDPASFEAKLIQFVHLLEGGDRTQMSKRSGEFVTLDELIDDIGVDAARFLMLQRSHDTPVDLDLELARSRSQDNPVYYVQYAHARIASILRKAAGEAGVDEESTVAAAAQEPALTASAEASERALVRRLLDLPSEIAAAAERRAPHRLTAYATATAADFHAFYRDCRVVGAEPATEQARLALCLATGRVLARTLDLLGVSAPERM